MPTIVTMSGAERVRAVRGATQVSGNTGGLVIAAVTELMEGIVRKNKISPESLISILFSQTKDLNALNPATALRTEGYRGVPLFCTQEPEYDDSLPRMIRVLVTYYGTMDVEPIPVYLNGARKLRPDLFGR